MLQCSIDAVRALHEFLLAGFSDDLQGEPNLNVPPTTQSAAYWQKGSYTGPVAFLLWDKHLKVFSNAPSRRCPILPLTGFSSDAVEIGWVSWLEQWMKSSKDGMLTLVDASFTFYWGRPYNVSQILFRAEWSNESKGCERAGHPHWQFDHEPLGSSMDVGSLHFGMAGWEHLGNFPNCWQRFPGATDHLQTWAIRTLHYSRLQLLEYPPVARPLS